MEDRQIIDLYWARSECAISETSGKYGNYCHAIAQRILHSHEDSEECVNDTWLRAWNAMPPQYPEHLAAFLGKITRNLALDRHKRYTAEKRGLSQVPLALEELQGCLPSGQRTEQAADDLAVVEILNRFLEGLSVEARKIFLQRYWYFRSVKEIAAEFGMGESKVKMSLMRSRGQLRQCLEKEGIWI